MARTIDNIYLLSQCLSAKFGTEEFSASDFFQMIKDALGLYDLRTLEKYYQIALESNQVKQSESGKLVANPHQPVTHRQYLARLKGEK